MNTITIQNNFKNLGLEVIDIFTGSDDLFNNVPQIVFKVENEQELASQKYKLQALIDIFYKNYGMRSKSKIKIASVTGLNTSKELPKYGYILYVGTLDDMESDTGIEDFDIYNKTHAQALTTTLSGHQVELENFCKFISEQ
jgi:hypothetical protein